MDIAQIGKSAYLWLTPAGYGGDQIPSLARLLRHAGFESIMLHEVNLSGWASGDRLALVDALRAEGVTPILSVAVYGDDPAAEGRKAAALCAQYGLPAATFDLESKWDSKPNAPANTTTLFRAFRAAAPAGTLAGMCWWARYRSPGGGTWHPVAVLRAGMDEADFGTPMAYHEGSTAEAAESLLNASWRQWREVTDKPLIPAGRAYNGDGGTATPEAVRAFEAAARSLGAPGVTWWSVGSALALPAVWDALVALPQYARSAPEPEPQPEPQPEPRPVPQPVPQPRPVPPPPVLTLDEMVRRLWEAHPELHDPPRKPVRRLYLPDVRA